jgi:hypothetical protein
MDRLPNFDADHPSNKRAKERVWQGLIQSVTATASQVKYYLIKIGITTASATPARWP